MHILLKKLLVWSVITVVKWCLVYKCGKFIAVSTVSFSALSFFNFRVQLYNVNPFLASHDLQMGFKKALVVDHHCM